MDVIWLIITTVIGGAIIGMLGKLVAPGDRDKIPFWLTVVCGIVGMLAGSYLYWALFGNNNPPFDGHKAEPDNATNGIDWIRGGDGRDRLWGGKDGDSLVGMAGRDILHGGPGKDRIIQ